MNEGACPGGRRRRIAAAAFVALSSVVSGSPVWAGTTDPTVPDTTSVQPVSGSPNPAGMPGAELVTKLVNWLMWVSLMASLGAVLYGAAMWRGGAKLGNSPRAEDGRHYVAGGAIGALLSGMAVVLVNTLFQVGRTGG